MSDIKVAYPFNFVVPQKTPELPETIITNAADLAPLGLLSQQDALAVDIETKGTQVCHPEHYIVGLSISDDKTAIYFDKRVLSEKDWKDLLSWLRSCDCLIAHNSVFDAGFLYVEDNYTWWNWKWDTMALAYQLSGEGFYGQRWGLKYLQKQILLWKNTNEKELDEWLIREGYYTGTCSAEYDTPEGRLHTWKNLRKKDGSPLIRPAKAMMYQAPPEILGKYCALDSYSTRKLLDIYLDSVEKKLGPKGQDTFIRHHCIGFMTSVRHHVSQQLSGIYTDPQGHLDTHKRLAEEVEVLRKKFLEDEGVAAGVAAMQQVLLDEKKTKEPTKYKKLPQLGNEPPQFTKSGAPSKNYIKWKERKDYIDSLGPGEISKTWESWRASYDEMIEDAKQGLLFNVGSGPQLAELFHKRLGIPITKTSDKTGEPATDEEAKIQWGEPGRILIERDVISKRMTYVKAAYNCSIECGDNIIHHRFKMPGTVTCRLAGGSVERGKDEAAFSLHQQPKDRAHMSNLKPPPGWKLVGRDWDSMEDKLLYDITRDKGLEHLYGKDAPKGNCAYIWVGSQLPVIGEDFIAAGYDPSNPSAEVVAHIKKTLKDKRSIAKVIKLGKNYGMGAKLFVQNMKAQGIDIPLDDAYEMMRGLDDIFEEAYKKLPALLEDEWIARGGWILSALGYPICVAHSKLKDITNRLVQNSAHTIHQWSIYFVEKVALERGWTTMWSPENSKKERFARPFLVDLHDEGIYAVREHLTEEWCDIMREADRRMNKWLNGHIPMTGDPEVGDSLADFKCED